MTSVIFINTLVASLVLGSVFSLVTLGYVVVYRASHVFNFMHPQFMLLGVFLYTTLSATLGGGQNFAVFGVSLLLSMFLVTLFSGLLYVTVVHRCAAMPHWIQMILTLGLGIAAVNIAQLFWGSSLRFLDVPLQRQRWGLPGGAVVSNIDVAVLLVGLALGGVLFWLLTVSPMALRLKATAEDPTLAAYSGVSLLFWFSVAWAIAAAAAVIGGVAYSVRIPADTNLTEVGLLAFPAAMMGGMDSIHGAFVGAFILGAIMQFGSLLFGAEFATIIAFTLVLVVLVFRPRGLFGSPVVERV